MTSGSGKRIGLLGGSFDPVHIAHIELAKAAIKHLNLDEVQLLPAKQPWQKPELATSAQDRLNMLELATDGLPGIVINPIELKRPGKTYTLDTLNELPREHAYFWLMGADQLANFPTWSNWQEIAKRLTLVAAQRPGNALQVPPALQTLIDAGQAHVQTLPFEPLAISSSALRELLAQQKPVDQWLVPKVITYIGQHRLYGVCGASNSSQQRPEQ